MAGKLAKRYVVAYGGNALQGVGDEGSAAQMRERLHEALPPLRSIIESGAQLVITHGNGPQVGNQLLRCDAGAAAAPPHPVDVAVATTQAEIGTLMTAELRLLFREWGVEREIACVVTHVRVAADDPALRNPTKPIGPFYSAERAEELGKLNGWQMVEDAGRGYRRVIGSPQPLQVMEAEPIREMIERGTVVIAGGGGGIPVTSDWTGVEAVIDKDRTSALLAEELAADGFVILTAVDAMYSDFGTPAQAPMERLTCAHARELLDAGTLPAGSMAPKVEASAAYAQRTGHDALITSHLVLADALEGRAGTRVVA